MLVLAGAALAPWDRLEATVYNHFWNKKDPAKWNQDEIDRLTTKSPWAKEVTATYAPGTNNNNGGYGNPNGNPNGGGYPGGQGGGMPRIGIGGIGMGGQRRGMGGGRGQGNGNNLSTYKGTVRWESAQPILDALKTPLPDAFANHYVISVIDFPLLTDQRRQDTDQDSGSSSGSGSGSSSGSSSSQQQDDQKTLDDLKQYTSLQPKDKDRAQPGIVQRQTTAGSIFLFGFKKDLFDFGKNDHEVDFSTRLGRLMIRAKFDPRDMMYHKKLAV